MKRRPDLPPRARGRSARGLTSAAAVGRFMLPVCAACGTVHYPPRPVCGICLADTLTWREVAAGGRVLATTELSHSLEPYFRDRLPWPIASIKLDAGPVALAHLAPGLAAEARVTLVNRLDRGGEAVLVALSQDKTQEEWTMADPNREIAGRTVLVTGANGGIGRALLAALVEGGAARILAGVRAPGALGKVDAKIEELVIDVTDHVSVAAALKDPGDAVDILINNAGVNRTEGLLDADSMAAAEAEMAVNYFGPLRMVRALAPAMRRRGSGVVVNMLTILSHANLPAIGSYCASKAAALSLTQGVRAELAPWGVRVIGVFPGAVDTEMSRDFPPPKMAPTAIAQAVVAAIRDGIEDVYPGRVAADLRDGLREDPKLVERELAALLPESR